MIRQKNRWLTTKSYQKIFIEIGIIHKNEESRKIKGALHIFKLINVLILKNKRQKKTTHCLFYEAIARARSVFTI